MSGASNFAIGVEIGGLPMALHTTDAAFARIVEDRYANFPCDPVHARIRLDVTIGKPDLTRADAELEVRRVDSRWIMRRGDFAARWDPESQAGVVTQSSANPWSIDSVIRIVHSLMLAESGGFLIHAASAIRNGRAFLFGGVSGAGKTTITRLAPSDAIRLSDEISYVRRVDGRYVACGTPFTGELNTSGTNATAPVATLYFLVKGDEHRVHPMPIAAAARKLLRNVLFFAEDEPAARVFESACDFVAVVPAFELIFKPESEVWKLVA
jgi:hypothetical protein